MQHKDQVEKDFKIIKNPEEAAMKQLEIDNLKKKIDELNKILVKTILKIQLSNLIYL